MFFHFPGTPPGFTPANPGKRVDNIPFFCYIDHEIESSNVC